MIRAGIVLDPGDMEDPQFETVALPCYIDRGFSSSTLVDNMFTQKLASCNAGIADFWRDQGWGNVVFSGSSL